MITDLHPFDFIKPIFETKDALFQFSRYVYTPDSLFDEREVFVLTGDEVTKSRIENEIAALRPDQELAFHSKIKIKGRTFHLPMVDFSMREVAGHRVFDRMSRYLPKNVMLNMAVYSSGRSYHSYSKTLLSPKEWLDFMGRLLLINPVDQSGIIDTRWIGHRLIGGFSSLRWSNNSGQYLGMPSRINFSDINY
ncbi:primase 1D-like protein [Laribacter hongkongensis]|uniref:primase 1D-like protein n=1 Tax=Laribacter hongkongensis TaxID=168471 RepID=UPI001EFDF3B8|nr:hypothetical protein [Laribacter hongkongensis]MCG9079172.1 hypothetical protein [Laribacter hongkongensis]